MRLKVGFSLSPAKILMFEGISLYLPKLHTFVGLAMNLDKNQVHIYIRVRESVWVLV